MVALHDAQIPFSDGDNLGIGIDSASGDRKNLAVNPQSPLAPIDAAGSTSQFTIKRIFTTSDLETELNIDASASMGIGSFGGGASARFDFAKNMKVQSSSLFMVVTAAVDLASESIDAPVLADVPPGAGASSVANNADLFSQRYGDMFVRSFQRGGFFVGVLQFDTESSSEADSISASLQGSYGLFSASASTNLQTAMSQSKSELFVDQYSEGGKILQIVNNDPTQLLASVNTFLQSFEQTPDAVAQPFTSNISPVTIAAGPLPPNAADRQHAQDVIIECAARRSATLDLLNLVQFISDKNADYDLSQTPGGMGAITNAINGFQSDLDVIAQCASNAINNPSAQTPMPPQFAATLTPPVPYPHSLPNPLPTRKPPLPQTVTIPNWTFIEDVDVNSTDGKGNVIKPSAASLGLKANEVGVDQGGGDFGDIISISPPAGTQVPPGTIVTVNFNTHRSE